MKQKIDCNWHRYVDLGLPSGLLWATCNVGAKEPWERGLYFSWGNVDGHEKGSGYRFSIAIDVNPYLSTPGAALTDNIPVGTKYDAARANLGGSWRMPTKDEFKELDYNCISEWTTQNGVNGMLFTSCINGKDAFFPATGIYYGTSLIDEGASGGYWSNSPLSNTYAHLLYVNSCGVHPHNDCCRIAGVTVRPVLDHPKGTLLIKTIKR